MLSLACSSPENTESTAQNTEEKKAHSEAVDKAILESYESMDSLKQKVDSMEFAIDTMHISESWKNELREDVLLMKRIIENLEESDMEICRIFEEE